MILRFDPEDNADGIVDILLLYEACRISRQATLQEFFTEHDGIVIGENLKAANSRIGRAVRALTGDEILRVARTVDVTYIPLLLDLIASHNRCVAPGMDMFVAELLRRGIPLQTLLAQKSLVTHHAALLRDALLADTAGGEVLIIKHLKADGHERMNLPEMSEEDKRGILGRYVDSEHADPDLLELVVQAPPSSGLPIDAEMRLSANRARTRRVESIFADAEFRETTYSVAIDAGLALEKVEDSSEDSFSIRYSRSWLEDTLDYPSILNNFQHLFGFTSWDALLAFPAFEADMSVISRLIGYSTPSKYRTGPAYDAVDFVSLAQTDLYSRFLSERGVDLLAVVAWFASDYLLEEFGASGFTFESPSPVGTAVERTRSILAETERLLRQFRIYAEEGKLDWALLEFDSRTVVYPTIPSLVEGKYVLPSPRSCEVQQVMELLFFDQSGMGYINSEIREKTLMDLIRRHELPLTTFNEYQLTRIGRLQDLGVLATHDDRVRFADEAQIAVLWRLHQRGAASFHRLPEAGKRATDSMTQKDWLIRESTLLTGEEASYFNFILNRSEFTNGPNLRNKYMHGAQGNDAANANYYNDYLIALRTLIALVIKINDDFCLAQAVEQRD